MRSDLSHMDKFLHVPGEDGGAYLIPRGGVQLRVVVSWGGGWDHISVSLPNRCPTWNELEWVKRQFFDPHEVAMQLHVGEDEHVNIHPNVLHIWRPQEADIPLPPAIYV